MSANCVSAIILAAGYSSRMGRFKPLLPMGHTLVIHRIIHLFQESHIPEIRVVIGHRAPEMRGALEASNVRIVENLEYDRGMFSSVKAGVKDLDAQRTGAFFIIPADICLVRPLTVRMLAAAYEKNPGKIIHPCFEGRRGHPPLIPMALVPPILKGEPDGGLKTILSQSEYLSLDVPVPDRQILMNMNHPKDYDAAQIRCQNLDIPDAAECASILTHICAAGEEIIRHCRKVAEIAEGLCRKLQKSGNSFDPDLIRAAALLHDIAKGRKDHAGAGGAMLRDMGFPRVAKIVSCQTDLCFKADARIGEAEVLYMARQMALNDQRIFLEEEFEMQKNRFHPALLTR